MGLFQFITFTKLRQNTAAVQILEIYLFFAHVQIITFNTLGSLIFQLKKLSNA
jgi:hypothetical protein